NLLTLLEAHIGLFPVAAAADLAARSALGLAFYVQDLHVANRYVEQLLDGLADLVLGRITGHPEGDLVVGVGQIGGFFRQVRTLDDGQHAFLVHTSRPSSFFRAGTVTSTFSKPIRLTGSTPSASSTSTPCRLREARERFLSTSALTISTLSSWNSLSLASRPLGLWLSSLKSSTTTRRP